MSNKKKIKHDFDFIGRIFDILRALYERTDECTTITQNEILNYMRVRKRPCSARTLSDYLKVMMKELNPETEYEVSDPCDPIEGYKIITKGLEEKLRNQSEEPEKQDSQKPQLRNLRYNHLFSFKELDQIVEAVLFLKNIDTDTKIRLIRKLQTLSSINYPKYSLYISETTGKIRTHISGIFENSRVDEDVVRKNLKIIRKAIEADEGAGRKITFLFNGYDEHKKLIPRKDSHGRLIRYVASPYYVILYNGKYYLICNIEPFNDVAFYRIDLMSEISDKTRKSYINDNLMVSERRKPKRDVAGLPLDWNENSASEFQSEHMYMFYGEPQNIRIKINRERYTLLHDYFGDRYTFKRHLDQEWDEVSVKCVPEAIISWVMQCSNYVEILSPEYVRNEICQRCKKLADRYN